MHSSASAPPAAVSLYDARPFFEKALQFGVQNGILDRDKLEAICTEAPKGMVQIARYFGNEFLRPDLEKARERIVNLVSLYLESSSGGDLIKAAESLRDHSFLSRSKGGSDMLKALLALPENTIFHADLDSSPASGPVKGLAEWSLKSFADYQAELARRRPLQQEKDAAAWLAARLDLDVEELEEAHTHAEAVIRTALLVLAAGGTQWPDWLALPMRSSKSNAFARFSSCSYILKISTNSRSRGSFSFIVAACVAASTSSFLSFEIFEPEFAGVKPYVSASSSLMMRFSSARESAES